MEQNNKPSEIPSLTHSCIILNYVMYAYHYLPLLDYFTIL
jgi:hypothetical protein